MSDDMEEIRQLKARYFRYMDTKDWAAWADVFTEDVVIDADGYRFEGRDKFIGTLSRMLDGVRTVHHGHMPEITITGPDTATGIWSMEDFLVWPGDGPRKGLKGYGHYHEEYLRRDGAWRIHRLVLTRLGVDPLEGGMPDVSA
jgi:uncharacterized protein (TIGR02246 family)